MKKFIFVAIFLSGLYLAPAVNAQETCVQVQVYGGGVGTVCGAKTHEAVPADIAGITPAMIAGGLFLASGTLVYLSRKFSRK